MRQSTSEQRVIRVCEASFYDEPLLGTSVSNSKLQKFASYSIQQERRGKREVDFENGVDGEGVREEVINTPLAVVGVVTRVT